MAGEGLSIKTGRALLLCALTGLVAGLALVVRYLAAHGFPAAERRALHGATDLGDITGTPGIVWEVKGGEAAKDASDKRVAAWFDEAREETGNADATYGFLIVQRRQKGVRDWWAVLDVCDLAKLVRCDSREQASNMHTRITLAQLVELLAIAGWTDTAANEIRGQEDMEAKYVQNRNRSA